MSKKETYPERHEWLDAVHRCKHLHPKTKNYAWAVYSHADKKTLFCYPNLDQLNQDLGGPKSSKNVSGHIRALERAGFIIVGSRMVQGRLSSNYTLVHPPVACEVHHGDLDLGWLYGAPAAPDTEPSALDPEPTALDLERSDHEEEGLTLSLTPSVNTVLDTLIEKPSASEIQEENRRNGNPSSSGSPILSDLDDRQSAASPPLADSEQGEDPLSLIGSSSGNGSRQNAATPHVAEEEVDLLAEIEAILYGSDVRQNAATPHVADVDKEVIWEPVPDSIPNEEW